MQTLKSAIEQAGKVSLGNGKMPGSTYASSATKCKTGGKLVNLKGSTCHKCYALKLEKIRPSVAMGWLANYEKATSLIAKNPMQWSKACAFQILRAYEKSFVPFHRWFDSGDLQSVEMLEAIAETARMTPDIQHWLPTRESQIVKEWRKLYKRPKNLMIRESATMVGDKPKNSEFTSTVHGKGDSPIGKECIAYRTASDNRILTIEEYKSHKKLSKAERESAGFTLGHCGPCRACWSDTVKNVSYPLH